MLTDVDFRSSYGGAQVPLFLATPKTKIRKMNPDLISVPEAAAILGITVPSVHYRIKNRSIIPVGTFAGSPVLSKKAIEALKSEIREKR